MKAKKNVKGVPEDRTHDPSHIRPACCHGSIRNTLKIMDERQNQNLLLTIRIASSMWPNVVSPPTCFGLSKGKICEKIPVLYHRLI